MNNWKIATRIAPGFAAVTILALTLVMYPAGQIRNKAEVRFTNAGLMDGTHSGIPIALPVALLLAILISVSVVGQFTVVEKKQLDRISRGDLTVEAKALPKKDVLGESLVNMLTALRKTVSEMNATEQLSLTRKTDLHALHAAVEAAGVREQGKGFAVVEPEVRKPAERSHTAEDAGQLLADCRAL